MKKKTVYFVSFFIIAIIAGFFSLQQFKKNINKVPYYQDLVIENIHLNGKSDNYTLKNGKIYRNELQLYNSTNKEEFERVLKLALFFQWAKEDPLLFDPTLDNESFKQSLARMKEQNEIWSGLTGLGYANPVVFFQSFLDASSEYHKFVQDVSENQANILLISMEKAQLNYVQDAERIGKVFSDYVSNGSDGGTLSFLGSDTKTNIRVIATDLEKIKENGDFLAIEIAKRENCLKYSQCVRPIVTLEKPVLAQQKLQTYPEILPFDEMGVYNEKIEGGPFEIHSPCWRGRSVNLMLEAQKCLLGDQFCVDWPFLSDGDYFALTGEKGEEALVAQGVKRRLQSASAPYGCMDLTYKPKLRNINFALNSYSDKKLFTEIVPNAQNAVEQEKIKEIWKSGAMFEDSFFNAAYPSDSALENLTQYYAFTYGFLVKHGLLDKNLQEDFLQRTNNLKSKMWGFDLIMDRSVHHFKQYLEIHKDGEEFKKYPIYTMAVRSDYSIMFLTFSSFVWRSGAQLQYFISKNDDSGLAKDIPDENIPILNREKAIDAYGKEKLNQWLMIAREISGKIK